MVRCANVRGAVCECAWSGVQMCVVRCAEVCSAVCGGVMGMYEGVLDDNYFKVYMGLS